MTDVKLTDDDRDQLLKFLEKYSKKISEKDISVIQKKLNKKIHHLEHNKNTPGYVSKMLKQIDDLYSLFDNPVITTSERNRVLAALHYFIWAEDQIPDYTPVIGYLDDAFLISVVHREVRKYITP